MENNLSTSTEDRKEKEAGSGGGRVKEGSESTLGCEGSAQRAVSRSQRERQGLRQTWRGCSSQREGQVQGPRGDAQGVQDKEAGEQSKNEGSEGRDRAGGALASLPITREGGEGRTDLA